MILGILGKRLHIRCDDCGIEYNLAVPKEDCTYAYCPVCNHDEYICIESN